MRIQQKPLGLSGVSKITLAPVNPKQTHLNMYQRLLCQNITHKEDFWWTTLTYQQDVM